MSVQVEETVRRRPPEQSPVVEELTVEERVANGMAFLDEHFPGWTERIDIATLDIKDPCFCIGGQLDWPDEFNLPPRGRNERLGIEAPYHEYPALTAAWKQALNA